MNMGPPALFDEPGARAIASRAGRVAIATSDEVVVHGANAVQRLDAAGSGLLDVALSADGLRVAAVGLDTLVRVWDTDSGALLGLLPGHAERVAAVEFLPDGDLVTASWDGSCRLWSVGALTASVEDLDAAVSAAWGARP